MGFSPTEVCLGWDCQLYKDDMSSYIQTDTPDYIVANIGLDTQDKCAETNGCFYALRLGVIAQTGHQMSVAEGAQNA